MAQSMIEVSRRTRVGKSGAKATRREGLIPGIVYGKSMESIPISVDPDNLKLALATESGENTLLEMKIKEDNGEIIKLALIKDVQFNPLTSEPIHFDFLQVEMEEKLVVRVPVRTVGKSIGINNGGILEEILRELEVECMPGAIPNAIEVDITELDIGGSVHVGDLPLSEGAVILQDSEATVLTIVAPSAVEAAAAEEEEAEEGAEEGVEGAETEEGEAETESSEE